ncbi:autotransporter domain-containing protein [Sphingosinicellaceae bacterium]|nr:autotransporter domain-containing protein [Sphingosinicellaceae bacterium]
MRKQTDARRAKLCLLVLGAVARPAWAGDLTVSNSQTTATTTSSADGAGPGNITVASGGSIITSSGTAVTIDSPNTVTNGGTIGSSAVSGTVALRFSGAGGSLVNNATIDITGTGGSGNTGILVSGANASGTISSGLTGVVTVTGDNALGVSVASAFTGNIGLRSVTVAGANSTAISLTAPLAGNLMLAGTNASTGAGGYGVLVAAPVSGTIANGSAISAGTARTTDSSGALVDGAVALAGLRVSAGVGTGIVNDRYYIDTTGAVVAPALVDTTVDTLVTGSITATGSAPALWVAPDANAPQALVVGAVGQGDGAFAIVNRGVISTSIATAGAAAVAIRVGGGGATTTLVGGINSQATATISAVALDAAATGVDLLAGATVPEFLNQGGLAVATSQSAASGSTPIGAGGAAYGLIVEPGASLPSLVNTGTITATATGANGSTAILDRSGSLTSIVNNGTITAVAVAGQAIRAIDLSAGTAGATVTNSGTITGDILFGSGASTLQVTAGTINGTITYGSGGGLLAISGTGVLDTTPISGTPLDVTLADTGKLSLASGTTTLRSVAASGNSVLVVPVQPGGSGLLVQGAASFTGNSTVVLSLQSLALNQSLAVIQADGGVTTDHLATLVDSALSSYLFTASAPILTPTTLSVVLLRKSAADIGLTGGQANLYNASIDALPAGSAEASAIANLPDRASVVAAYRQITPPSASSAPLRIAESLADTGFGAAAQRLEVIDAIRRQGGHGIGVWGQELGDFQKEAAGTEDLGFTSSALGIAGGIDTPFLRHGTVGISVLTNFASMKLNGGDGLADVPLHISTEGIAPYASWSWKMFYVQAMGLAAKVKYSSSRTLSIGSFSDTVDADWHGTQFGAGLTLGARFDFGRLEINPSNSVHWTRLKQDGYTETGGGAFALAVDGRSDTVATDAVRMSLAYLLPLTDDAKLSIEAHAGYVHQFKDNPKQTAAEFISASDAIDLPADVEKEDKAAYGGSFGYLQDSLAVRLGYDRRASSAYRDQSVALTAGFAF